MAEKLKSRYPSPSFQRLLREKERLEGKQLVKENYGLLWSKQFFEEAEAEAAAAKEEKGRQAFLEVGREMARSFQAYQTRREAERWQSRENAELYSIYSTLPSWIEIGT